MRPADLMSDSFDEKPVMLIEKVRRNLVGFNSATTKDGKEFFLLALSLSKVEMAESIIRVDEVLKDWEEDGGLRGKHGTQLLRKAMEGNQ